VQGETKPSGGEMARGKRELIDTGKDKRFVRRAEAIRGDQGRSLQRI
jgi:hypothetical protein